MIDIDNIKDNVYYSSKEAAELLNITYKVLLKKAMNNEIKYKKMNNKNLFILGIDIKDYINKNLK